MGQTQHDFSNLPSPQLPSQGPTFNQPVSEPQVYYINTFNGLVKKTCQTTRQGQTYCY